MPDARHKISNFESEVDYSQVANKIREQVQALCNIDGVTIILRDGDLCYYVAERAISPLWVGRRFPLLSCISGWAILHAEPVYIRDIYADVRIPHDAYRPTFVKSLAMLPLRQQYPLGAVGFYWAKNYTPTSVIIEVLQVVVDAAASKIERLREAALADKVPATADT